MAHGKSLELAKIRPRFRIWANPGKITLVRGDWKEIQKRAGWDYAPLYKEGSKIVSKGVEGKA